jgi:uncharacterized protein YjbI with pentapeptide repeats
METAAFLSRGYKYVVSGVKNHLKLFLTIGIVLLSLIAVVVSSHIRHRLGFDWHDGTGFEDKTLWDWMELLIIPSVLSVGAFLFNRSERRSEQSIAKDQQREEALQMYLDKMTQLLIDKHLRLYKEVKQVGRSRTLTALRQLDGDRKRDVIQFLDEAELIQTDQPVISLRLADLRGSNLSGAGLKWVNFRKVDLSGADLREANLKAAMLSDSKLVDADLRGADLMGVDLGGADLTGAKVSDKQLRYSRSLKGAIMPDGTIHD